MVYTYNQPPSRCPFKDKVMVLIHLLSFNPSNSIEYLVDFIDFKKNSL